MLYDKLWFDPFENRWYGDYSSVDFPDNPPCPMCGGHTIITRHRIVEKGLFSGYWHSNVDVQAIYSLRGGLRYLGKYLMKSIDARDMDFKTRRTLALCWAFSKRAYSVSGDFREVLLQHSKVKTEVEKRESKWVVIAFIAGDSLGLKRDQWFTELDLKQVNDLLALIRPCPFRQRRERVRS